MTGGGDQAYGDLIRFSYDCDNPIINETEIMRSNDPSYDNVKISPLYLLIDLHFKYFQSNWRLLFLLESSIYARFFSSSSL